MSRLGPARLLDRLARQYQRETVLPRCACCSAPCCRLETLVLELDWARLSGLWRVEGARREFDAALARGQGPPEIRPQEGLYYAHGRVCPAYDEGTALCRVYGGPLKPPGCGTFPVYEDRGRLVADLRCEAVELAELEGLVRDHLRAGEDVRPAADRDFPFLVTLSVRSARIRPPPRRGRAERP